MATDTKQNVPLYHFVQKPVALDLEDKAMFIWQNVKTAYGLDRVWVRVPQVGKVGEVMLAYEEVCSLPARAQHSITQRQMRFATSRCNYRQANAVSGKGYAAHLPNSN